MPVSRRRAAVSRTSNVPSRRRRTTKSPSLMQTSVMAVPPAGVGLVVIDQRGDHLGEQIRGRARTQRDEPGALAVGELDVQPAAPEGDRAVVGQGGEHRRRDVTCQDRSGRSARRANRVSPRATKSRMFSTFSAGHIALARGRAFPARRAPAEPAAMNGAVGAGAGDVPGEARPCGPRPRRAARFAFRDRGAGARERPRRRAPGRRRRRAAPGGR